jgi:hypothetical protein
MVADTRKKRFPITGVFEIVENEYSMLAIWISEERFERSQRDQLSFHGRNAKRESKFEV